MKFLCERDAIKDALAGVIGHTKGAKKLPILQHILCEAKGQQVLLTGHDMTLCSQVRISAEVSDPGRVALPADRLHQLVSGLPSGAQFLFQMEGVRAKIKCGRSVYQMPTLAADTYPDLLSTGDAVEVRLTRDQVTRLFKTPAPACITTNDRPHLSGIYLHKRKGEVCAAATDAQVLLRTKVTVDSEEFDGVIVPAPSCAEIVRIAGDGETTLRIGETLLSAEHGNRIFVTRLIDGEYPEYERHLPSPTAPHVLVEREDLDGALHRLLAARDPELLPVVRFDLADRPEYLDASVETQLGRGEERIDCEAADRNAGHISFQISNLKRITGAMSGERIKLYIAGPADPMLVEDPKDPDIVALCLTCR